MLKKNTNTKNKVDENLKESQRILDRVETDGESLGRSSMARTANKVSEHFSGRENPEDDAIEILGKRIGRGLSLVAFIALATYLLFAYVLI